MGRGAGNGGTACMEELVLVSWDMRKRETILPGRPAPYWQRKGRTCAFACSLTLSTALGTFNQYLGRDGKRNYQL